MIKRPDTNKQRLVRHKRVRAKISGTPERPRLNVFRSGANIYAQVIDDVNGVTICAASSIEKGFEGSGGKPRSCQEVGLMIAERAKGEGHYNRSVRRAVLYFPRPCSEFSRGSPRGGLVF